MDRQVSLYICNDKYDTSYYGMGYGKCKLPKDRPKQKGLLQEGYYIEGVLHDRRVRHRRRRAQRRNEQRQQLGCPRHDILTLF
jgi:hypothetical protein